jgi:hypothetical protein
MKYEGREYIVRLAIHEGKKPIPENVCSKLKKYERACNRVRSGNGPFLAIARESAAISATSSTDTPMSALDLNAGHAHAGSED